MCSEWLPAGPFAFAVAIALSGIIGQAGATEIAQTPSAIASLHDTLVAYGLPVLDESVEELAFIRETQAFVRSQDLHFDAASPYDVLSQAAALYEEIAAAWPAQDTPQTIVRFEGTRTSELTAFLAGKSDLVVTMPPSLIVDAPIVVQGDGITLDTAGATFDTTQFTGSYVLHIEAHDRIRITHLELHSVRSNGILISEAHQIVVADCRFVDVAGNPIVVVGDTDHFDISASQFLRSGRAAIHVEHGPRMGLIRDNVITEGTSSLNFHAGILLSDRGGHDLHQPELIRTVGRRITDRLQTPRDIIVAGNTIDANLSSGIYSDGACRNLILQNRILSNSKEGICLDNGSTANVVADNLIQGNGQRYGMTDAQLESDYVLRYGRMDDGTAKAKLPGVSIDNALYNVVLQNTIADNSGGGVKMVRTAFYNTIMMNVIDSNNAGQSDRFSYFGIELGAATPDEPIEELDFTASCGNIIAANQIVGSHYVGIAFAGGSIFNHVLDNVILNPTHRSIQSSALQHNIFNNNTASDFFAGTLPCGAGTAEASLMTMFALLSLHTVLPRSTGGRRHERATARDGR